MIDHERMNDGFEKFHLNKYGNQPWTSRPVIHKFTQPDEGFPHDHPFNFRSYIFYGGFVEEVFTIGEEGSWSRHVERHKNGSVRRVDARQIHRIIEITGRPCMSFVEYGPTIRTSMFYDFRTDLSIWCRPWHTDDWQPWSEARCSQP